MFFWNKVKIETFYIIVAKKTTKYAAAIRTKGINKMNTFTATDRKTGKTIEVKANDYHDAGNKAAKKLCNSKMVIGRRATGDASKSGVFVAYEFLNKTNSYVHQGLEFHLSQD